MKKLYIVLIFTLTSSLAFAQTGLANLFTKSFEIVNEKSGKERFKGQILKGKRNGMGAVLTKKGAVYIGDFYHDEMTGLGMMIAADGTSVDHCEDCVVYVGNWKEGSKSGFGKCYDIDGNIIYKGQFADGKPTGTYPTDKSNADNRQLSLIDLDDNNLFLGETLNGIPNGLGVVIYPDGAFWFHSFKEGIAKGIGLYAARDGEWQTLKWDNGEAVTVSSSEYYKQIDYARKASLRNALMGVSNEFNEAMEQQQVIFNAGRTSGSIGAEESVSGGSSSTSHSASAKSGKCKDCAGNGNCSGGTKPSSRYHCHGSKKCGWCNGDGYNYTAGNPVKCSKCNGRKKCTYCNGTGKCQTCGGSGKV